MSRRLVLALLGAAAIVASCSSPGSQPSTPTAVESPSPSATEQPSASPREMVLCPSEVLGPCRGPLEPGTYRAIEFETPFSYTVPDGWANYEDLPGNFLLLPPGEELPGVNNDTSEFIGLYDGVAPASANCDEVREPGIGVTPDAMATWYANHPGLAASEAQPVNVGGLEGLVIDLDLADDHTATCPYAHAGEPLVPLLIGNGPAGLHHVLNASFATRLYLLTAPGGETIAIEVVDHAGRLTLEELSAVVETIEFGQDPLAGTWSTGSVSFTDVRAAMLAAGLEDSNFFAWAEGQDLAPWPEDSGAPSEIAMELRLTAEGRWEISVDSGGQSIGVVDAGTYELRDAELHLTSDADGDVGRFGAELGTDSLTLALLDTVEVGTADAAYIHQLYAIALFASTPFERAHR